MNPFILAMISEILTAFSSSRVRFENRGYGSWGGWVEDVDVDVFVGGSGRRGR